MKPHPRELLEGLVLALDQDAPVPPAVRDWLWTAVASWQPGDEPLEKTLGLVGDQALAFRDAALAEAAAILAPGEAFGPAAKVLLKHVRYFEREHWPKAKHPPLATFTGWKRSVYRAFLSGRVIPESERQLREIFKKQFPGDGCLIPKHEHNGADQPAGHEHEGVKQHVR